MARGDSRRGGGARQIRSARYFRPGRGRANDGEGKMMLTALESVFTMEIDGRPTVTFEANSLREASELCKEDWLRADLSVLKSNGVALCGPSAKLRVRMASETERRTYWAAEREVQASEDLVLAYLVELDGPFEE